MKGWERFLCFILPFAVCVDVAYGLHWFVGAVVAGIGFAIAYCYGEKR